MPIAIRQGGEELLILTQSLWNLTKAHHIEKSTHFRQRFIDQSFEARKAELTELCKSGQLRVLLAQEEEDQRYVGFCVATVNAKRIGKIESLFVDPANRRQGIAESLMLAAKDWMKSRSVQTWTLTVAVGNEDVMDFYRKFGFQPFLISMEAGLD